MEVECPWVQSPVPQKIVVLHFVVFKIRKRFVKSWAWWHTLVILVLGRLRQEDCRFLANLSYLVRPSATS